MPQEIKNASQFADKMERVIGDLCVHQLGLKTAQDFERLALASRVANACKMSDVPQEIMDLSSSELSNRVMNLVTQDSVTSGLKFQTSGSFTIDNFTKVIGTLITEDPDYGTSVERNCYMDDVIKDGGMMADSLIKPIYAAGGGLMDSVVPKAGVPMVKKLDYRLEQVTGQRYANSILFDDLEMLFTRYQGGSDVAMRGFTQVLSRNMVKLMTIKHNRKQLLKASVITGGETVFRYGSDFPSVMTYNIPGFNQNIPISGNNWGTINPVTGQVIPNGSADIIGDLNYLLFSYSAWLAAQSQIQSGDIVMNPRTMLLIMQNPTIRALLAAYNVNPASPLSPYDNFTVNIVIHSLLPGFNGRVIEDNSAYLAEDSSVAWATDGGQTWGAAPEQKYFFPDGYVFFRTTQTEGPIGEFIYQPALQNGGSMNPGMGDWVAYQDMSGAAWPEGMTRPHSLLTCGFQAGVFLARPIALRTLYVL